MDNTNYGITATLDLDFDTAVDRTIACLKDQGFGVLTDIDIKSTLKEKLDVDFRKYRILGACNPPLAYQALSAETDLGLLLPCNVIVSEVSDTATRVAVIDPVAAMSVVGHDRIKPVAEQVRAKMTAVIQALENLPPN